MNDSLYAYVDDPTVAVSAGGDIAVAWADQARKDVFLQVYGPAGNTRFAEPVNVSRSPAIFSWLPRLVFAAGESSHIYALWQEIVFSGGSHGGEIYFARSTDGGASFDLPINLSNSVAGDGKGRLTDELWDNGSLDLAAGPGGRLHAAWTTYEGQLWVSRSTDRGASFITPVRVGGSSDRPARGPALATERNGTVHLAWSEGGLPAANIRLAHSTDGGRSFGVPHLVASSGHADAPKIAADSRGTLHLVYGEDPAGPPSQYHIRYARREPGSGRFSAPMTIATGAESANYPDLVTDGADRLYIAWKRYLAPGRRAQGLGFALSRDGGRSISGVQIVPESDRRGFSGSLQGSLAERLSVNTSGDVAVVSSSFDSNRASHIWLWRRPAAPP